MYGIYLIIIIIFNYVLCLKNFYIIYIQREGVTVYRWGIFVKESNEFIMCVYLCLLVLL
jgi:hypothetical protein